MKRFLVPLLGLLIWAAPAHAQDTAALLDSVQYSAFRFFWYEANPSSGLIKDRNTSGSPCSIASLGFGLSSICIGIDHGWVTRAEGKARVLAALQTLWNAPQGTATFGTAGYKGLYYHFLDMNTGLRMPGWNPELSTIDTALLFAGILDCKQYFTLSDPTEDQIRALADAICHRADWAFMQNGGPGIKMGWTPENGFTNFGQWIGYNEAMILYILAIGSPTHPVPGSAWNTWTSGYVWATQRGQTYVLFPPLFGHQYSHCWIDFRTAQDAYMTGKGITYFENSRRATYAQRAYCIANPLHFTGFSDSLWGITAGDGPNGYTARGAPPWQNDDGTISPTAPASSIAFAPEICIPAIRNIYNAYHTQTWGSYGFSDGFNLTANWWDIDDIGIDQGPIVLMIENYLNGGVWGRMMQNADVVRGMQLAGFSGVVAVEPGRAEPVPDHLYPSAPNPMRERATLRFQLATAGHARLVIFDLQGRRVASLVDEDLASGPHVVTLDGRRLSPGVYHVLLEAHGRRQAMRLVRLDW